MHISTCWSPIDITIETLESYSSGAELAYLASVKDDRPPTHRIMLYDSEYYISESMDKYGQMSISWLRARHLCDLYHKSDLLIIDNSEEYKFLQYRPRISMRVFNVRDNFMLTSIIYIGFTISQVM